MAWSNLCRRTIGLPLFPLIYNFSPVSHFHFCSRLLCEMIAEEEKIQEVKGFAFNHVEKKKGLFKPNHTIEEQINYMQSKGRFLLLSSHYFIKCILHGKMRVFKNIRGLI